MLPYQDRKDIPICANFVIEIEPMSNPIQNKKIPLLLEGSFVLNLRRFIGVRNLANFALLTKATYFNNIVT